VTPTTFRRHGSALLGPQWQRPLAAALTDDGKPVSDRTVRRWAAGSSPVPEEVAAWLRERLAEKVRQDSKLLESEARRAALAGREAGR
jgi:hypothetical protein